MASVKKTTVHHTTEIITMAWEAVKAVCFGMLTGSPWLEYTPIGKDKKPLPKVIVEGVVDGNKVCRFAKVGKQADKMEFCRLLNLILKTPTKYQTESVKQPCKPGVNTTWFTLLVHLIGERGIKCIHYRPSFEWSGKDINGNLVFGLGSDWALFYQRWEEHKDEFKVAELYGKEEWGEYIMSPLNVLELVRKAIDNKMAITPPPERGRGKKAKVVQVIVNDNLIDAALAAIEKK